MNQDNRPILWGSDDHPSVELLRQYQQGALPPDLNHPLERHLLDCDLCSDVLEGMAVAGPVKTKAAVQRINDMVAARTKKKKRRTLPMYLTDWRVAAAILLVMFSTVLVLLYNYKQLKHPKQTMASEAEQAIQESMDLGETQAAEPENMAALAPDTVRETTAPAAKPAPAKRAVPVPLAHADAVTAPRQEMLATEAMGIQAEPVTATPATPQGAKAAPTAAPISLQNNLARIPDSAAVPKALAGRVAGVSVRGNNILRQKQVQGQVLSADGQPLPGVAVTVKGTSTVVATDASGNFVLSVPADKSVLRFSYIGFESQEKPVGNDTQNLTVNLKADSKALSEVVVTGYGRAGKEATPPALVSARPRIGKRAYKQYLEENIRYTDESVKGRVVVQATVAENGALQNLQIVKSLCPSCDQEALRLIELGPGWEPATEDKTAVSQQVRITVRFKPAQRN